MLQLNIHYTNGNKSENLLTQSSCYIILCYIHYSMYNMRALWVQCLFPGVKRPGRKVDHPPNLGPRLKRE